MSPSTVFLLSLALAGALANDVPIDSPWKEYFTPAVAPYTYRPRAGEAFGMRWELPNSRSDEPYQAICTFWAAKPGKPSAGFTITRTADGDVSFSGAPFQGRAKVVAPGNLDGYLVVEINPVKRRDAGKYVCVVVTDCCATPAWFHVLQVASKQRRLPAE